MFLNRKNKHTTEKIRTHIVNNKLLKSRTLSGDFNYIARNPISICSKKIEDACSTPSIPTNIGYKK